MNILKDLDGYSGIYYFDENYNICSYRIGRPMKYEKTNKGYYRLNLQKNGIKSRMHVHRIIALNFVDNPDNKPQINHIDNNRTNNSPRNLEWTTQSENLLHMHKQGRHTRSVKGEANRLNATKKACSKLSNKDVLEIRKIGRTISQKKLADKFNVSTFAIHRVLNNLSYTDVKE